MMSLIDSIREGLSSRADTQRLLFEWVIERIQPRAVSYEEPLMKVCECLSRLYEEQKDWSHAADTLARIDLESGMRIVDSGYKLGNCIKISRLYLQDGNIGSADVYLKKASSLLTGAGAAGQTSLLLQYQACSAMILDRKKKFTEASIKYYDLSKHLSAAEDDTATMDGHVMMSKQDALDCAIRCAILAAAGPQRSKILSLLHKDEECIKRPLFEVLDKVYLERMLLSEDVERFSVLLRTHGQSVVDSQHALTMLDVAVVQHNLEACSKLYVNITFSSLARLLHIAEERVQHIVATMIREGRLPAEIDQVKELVIFHRDTVDRSSVPQNLASSHSRVPYPTHSDGSGMTTVRHTTQVEEALRLADRALALAKSV